MQNIIKILLVPMMVIGINSNMSCSMELGNNNNQINIDNVEHNNKLNINMYKDYDLHQL